MKIHTVFLQRLCGEAWRHANAYTTDVLTIDVTLIDFDGTQLASYPDDR